MTKQHKWLSLSQTVTHTQQFYTVHKSKCCVKSKTKLLLSFWNTENNFHECLNVSNKNLSFSLWLIYSDFFSNSRCSIFIVVENAKKTTSLRSKEQLSDLHWNRNDRLKTESINRIRWHWNSMCVKLMYLVHLIDVSMFQMFLFEYRNRLVLGLHRVTNFYLMRDLII